MNVPISRFLMACRGRPTDAVPVWFMRQAGRYIKEYQELRKKYSILALAKTPELAAEVTLQPLKLMDLDAAIVFSDILLPAEAMGLKVRFNPRPSIEPPIRGRRDIERLDDRGAVGRLSCVIEAIRLVRRELGGRRALIGFAAAPFTLASYMIEGGPSAHFLKTKALMREEPRAWELLMRKIRRVTADFLKAQVKAGAQAVQLFDSWVGALTPEDYRRRALPHSRWVLNQLKEFPAPTVHFGTQTSGFLEDFASAGGDVVGIDWRIDLAEARKRVGPGQALQGNLDPALLLAPRPVLKKAALEVLRQARGRSGWRGFIFNLGHGILPQTPVDNVRAVVDWVHEYSHV